MSSEQDRDHPIMWDWTDEGGGGGNYHVAVASSPHWAYPNDDTDFPNDCDCSDLPPPPKFGLPPPPVPFGNAGDDCHSSDAAGHHSESDQSQVTGGGSRLLSDLEYCDMRVLEGPYTRTAIPSPFLIIGFSFVMLVMVLIAFLLFRKHKRKMQNFLPCKASPGNHCDLTGGNGVLYDDLTNIRPRNLTNHCAPNQTVAPMEHPEDNTLLDVKCSNYGGAGFTSVGNTTFIYQPALADENFVLKNSCKAKEHFNPAYDGKGRDSDFGSDREDDDYEEAATVEEDRSDVEPGRRTTTTTTTTSKSGENRNRSRATRRSSVSSEGELAEDELSLVDFPPKKSYTEDGRSPGSCSGDSSLRGSTGDDLCRDFDSVYSEDIETATKSTTGSRDTFQGPPVDEEEEQVIFPYDGPSTSSGERKRRRKRGRATAPRRDHRQNAYPVYSEICDDRVVKMPSSRSDQCVMDQVPARYKRNGTGPPTWRRSDLDNEDVYDGYRNGMNSAANPEMVLMIPAHRRDLPRPPSGLGGGDLGLKSQVGGTGYRNNLGDDHRHHHPHHPVHNRAVPDEFSGQQQQQQQQQPLWGPDYPPSSVNHRNSDPHERSLAEFSTFLPKRGSVPIRDLYGLDAGHLNNDVGVSSSTGPYSHLPAGHHRNSGSEGSRSSTSSAERLLPVNPYQQQQQQQQQHHPPLPHSFRQNHNHHPQSASHSSPSTNINRQNQANFLQEMLPGSPAGISAPPPPSQHRVAFTPNQRSNNRRKSVNKSTVAAGYADGTDLDAPYGARTVFT